MICGERKNGKGIYHYNKGKEISMRSVLKVRSPSGHRTFLYMFLFSIFLLTILFYPVFAEDGDAGELTIP